jgi:RluA family pseudouridine synthase
MEKLLQIIHEDSDLLAVNKPAGLVCHPTKTDAWSSLIGRVRLHATNGVSSDLAGTAPRATGGDSRPHLINRLDRETSGVVLVAKRDDVARELRRIWEGRGVRKEYLAIVHGHVTAGAGVIDAPLGKDDRSGVAIKDCVRGDGAASQTEFRVERRFVRSEGPFTLLQVVPRTGRKHQIRIHLAHAGYPVVGDKLYGGDEDIYLDLVRGRLTEEQRRGLILPWQALHARGLRFDWRGREWSFEAEPEGWFREFANG